MKSTRKAYLEICGWIIDWKTTFEVAELAVLKCNVNIGARKTTFLAKNRRLIINQSINVTKVHPVKKVDSDVLD